MSWSTLYGTRIIAGLQSEVGDVCPTCQVVGRHTINAHAAYIYEDTYTCCCCGLSFPRADKTTRAFCLMVCILYVFAMIRRMCMRVCMCVVLCARKKYLVLDFFFSLFADRGRRNRRLHPRGLAGGCSYSSKQPVWLKTKASVRCGYQPALYYRGPTSPALVALHLELKIRLCNKVLFAQLIATKFSWRRDVSQNPTPLNKA